MKYRKDGEAMIELVFDQSTKAAMKGAGRFKKSFSNSINSDGVVYIGDNLDIGDIQGGLTGRERRKVYDKLWREVYLDEEDRDKYFNEQTKDMDKLIQAAKNGETIRIWKGNSPAEMCGFAFVCNLLEEVNCDIRVISLPEYIVRDDGVIESHIDWTSINPGDFHKFISYERRFTKIEKTMYSGIWEDLKEENSNLRALVNGSLISVPEDFYDHLIVKMIPKEEYTRGELLASVIGKYQIGVSDLWYKLRIDLMIKKGILEVVSVDKNSGEDKFILKNY